MKIKGFQKTSLVDYPDNVAAIVFVPGCNFRCGFCYNRDLVIDSPDLPEIPVKHVLDTLRERRKYLDGVVVTGGEPTLYDDLPDFLKEIKELNLLVKLDTNGYKPEALKKVFSQKLVDYIAMDVKTSLEKYAIAANSRVDLDKIKESTQLIRDSGVEYEFRTTCVPQIVEKDDVRKIGEWLKGAEKYALQQFRPLTTLDPAFEKVEPRSEKTLEEFKREAEKYFKKVELRGL